MNDISELFLDMGKTEIIYAALRDQDQVDGALEDLWVVTEHLPNPPLDAIAGDGSANLLRDRDPDPRFSRRRAAKIINESTTVTTLAATLETEEVPAALEATLWAKPHLSSRADRHGSRPNYLIGVETVRLLRPLRRRAVRTDRPPGLADRARKPCLFFRLRLLGW